jgi:hypothetical protein
LGDRTGAYTVWWEIPEGKNHLEDIRINGRIKLT